MLPPVNGSFRLSSNIVRDPSTLADNLKEQQKLELDQHRTAIKLYSAYERLELAANYLVISKNGTDTVSIVVRKTFSVLCGVYRHKLVKWKDRVA